MKQDLKEEVALPEKVNVTLNGTTLIVKSTKGESSRDFVHPQIKVSLENGKVIFFASKATAREKKVMYAFVAHFKNMIKGAEEPHVYKLKICSGHFPMNVAVVGNEFVVKNFLGESVPRKVPINKKVEIKISGTEIIVTSVDKEAAGQMAARIETLCRLTNGRDIRIFQDGCYIVTKCGKGVVN